MPIILKSLIQSDFRTGEHHGNFEAVVLQGDQLIHFWRDNADSALLWKRGQIIVPRRVAATSSSGIILSKLSDANRSLSSPCLRKRVEKPA
jgi:hypothetical protein